MTTLYADNFTDYTANNRPSLFENGWNQTADTGVETYSTPNIRSGINNYRSTYGTNNVRPVSSSSTTVFMSLAFYMNSMPSSGTTFLQLASLLDAPLTNTFATFIVYGDGEIGITNGSTNYKSTGAGVTGSAWHWFEVKVVIANSGGSIQVRNSTGTTVLNTTGIDSQPGATTNVGAIRIGATTVSQLSITAQVTDLHVWDGAGSICNDFTGPTQIDNLYPNGAGASTQWTPSTGANWQCVDEVPASKTDFVSTAGENNTFADLYEFTNLIATPANIYSVVATTFCNKTNAGPGQLKLSARTGTTTSSGSAQALPANGNNRLSQVFEVDPTTSAAWTAAGVNGAQFGFEVSS